MIKTLFLSVLLVWGAAVSLCAASGIKGKVIDASSQAAIEYAHVVLYSGDKPVADAMTSPEGSFQISSLSAGEYMLTVRMLGYDLYAQPIVIAGDDGVKDAGTIPLKVLEVGLGEVEVVANKKQIIYKLDKRVVEASSNLLAGGGSAVDILENTPSIRVDAEGEVTFRGSSGFAVYVDGKPSVFSGTQALEQIPAGHIENIEIITTPSARHDTEGAVGIINVVTKKDMQQGVSGIVNLSGSTVLTRTADFLLTNQMKASRWFIGGNFSERLRKSHFNQQKTTIVGDESTVSHSDGPREGKVFNYALKAGWQYSLPRTTFDADVEGGYGGSTRDGDLNYSEIRKTGETVLDQGEYFSRDHYSINETYFLGNVGMLHKFNDKGHQLSARFYAKYGGDALEYFQSDLFDKNDERQQGHRAYEAEHRWTTRANVDYIYPYSPTGRLEAGYQYFSYLEDGDYNMDFWDPEKKEFYRSKEIYNTFYFMHGINSIYAIWAETWKSFEFQAGLRGEHTHRVLRSSVKGSDRTYNRFELFPSVHAGYHFPNDHVLMASYSRRITRPQLFFMEPYITYRDYYSAEIGNPDIRAEYINVYELNYKKNFGQHSISASAFHRTRKDKIERLRVPYEAGVTLDSMANVGNDYASGLELTLQLQATRWWNVNVNGSLYHYKVKNRLQALGTDESSTNYDFSVNNGFDAGRYTRIQVDGNFIGPSVTTQGRTNAFWYMNLAVRQQLFNRRLGATLSFRDVFNSARYVSHISTSNLESITRIRPQYPLITLTLSYTFNNYRSRATQARESHDLFEGTNH
jgi:outer membrane receptor protein involved in Fe transport